MYFPDLSPHFKKNLDALPKGIAILGHIRPDGDCIGSQVALCRVLNALGYNAIAINEHPAPRTLAFLVKNTPFYRASEYPKAKHVPISCDCADIDRIGPTLRSTFPQIELSIDHHITNTRFAHKNFVIPDAAATCEIIAGICFDNGYPIDATTANALYVGIATDTGQFRFPATSKRVFELASELIDAGADPSLCAGELYEQESFGSIQLLQAFLHSLKLECGGRVCIGQMPAGIYEAHNAHYDDSEGFVDYARKIQGVEIGILLEQRGDKLKGSLRSKDPSVRVDKIAQSLGGGGHPCAAGFSQDIDLDSFYPKMLDIVNEHLNSISK